LGGSGHAEGTTQAAVAEGTIIIRDQASQEQDLAGLSRDTDHANGSIAPIFDKEKEQKRLQMAQMAGEIAGQMVSIVQTLGDVRGLEAAKNKGVTGTAKELRESAAYRTAQRDYGTGGKYQMVTQSVSGILSGLVGGNAMQAAAGGLNPWVAQVIRQQTTDENNHVNVAANAAAHAVWGAVAAQMSGGNAGAGAAGAFSGELAGRFIAEHLYGADSAEKVAGLSEEERHELSLMSTLAAGLAGGLAGNSTAATTTGAQAGKNAVENNSLNAQDEKKRQDAKWSLPYLEGEKKQQAEKLVSDLNAKDKAFDAALDSACKNLSSTACQGMRQELSAMAKSYDEQMDGQYVGTMRSVYADGAKQVDGQMWQYASADAKAQREADIGRIAENWDVSKETAASLYDGMAFVHTTAAIGGAAYGMKGSSSAAKGSSSVVEAEKAALDRISQNSKDTVNLNSKQNYSVLDQQAAKTNVIIEPDKLKYLFGEVNSSAHNTPRSTQLAQSMYRLGIPLDDAGAKLIMEHISQVPKTSGNIVNVYSNQFGKFEVRESMLMGPSGKAAKLETSFQIMDDGSRRFITTIPKDGKK
ncbi:VENN motif pre-toxin domain-containing protein, partial [Erwinia sp. P6884]|uniref:VENN motif pre-toxin domain-containing protein n=1 Tax=Erwinia sp. P6884 TaxID=3141450 RepID=UPI00318F34E2